MLVVELVQESQLQYIAKLKAEEQTGEANGVDEALGANINDELYENLDQTRKNTVNRLRARGVFKTGPSKGTTANISIADSFRRGQLYQQSQQIQNELQVQQQQLIQSRQAQKLPQGRPLLNATIPNLIPTLNQQIPTQSKSISPRKRKSSKNATFFVDTTCLSNPISDTCFINTHKPFLKFC